MNGTERKIRIFSSVEELNEFASEEIARIAKQAITERGLFTIALSGGSTPRKLYQLLAEPDFQGRINWHQTHFFFGDERFVPADAEESNFRMVNEALFSKINVPPQNIHRFLTEQKSPQLAAEKMEKTLREFFGLAETEIPSFDLILLGMGADGHTASLFPETSALKETERLVIANYVERFDTFRLTFTISTINHARNIIFLVSGEDKAQTLREVLQGEYNPEKFPTQLVKPEKGNFNFLIDESAASRLNQSI